MTFSQFCSSQYVFANTIIDKNVDPELVNKLIRDAQDIDIQAVIGYNLYQKLMNDIATSGGPTGMYLTLMTDYIQRALVKYVLYRSYLPINYHLTNKAVAEKSTDNDKPTEMTNVRFLMEKSKNDAEFYCVRIREFIINNQGSFPEYFQYGPNRLAIQPRPENYYGGIYLPRASGPVGKSMFPSTNDPAFPRC